MIKTVTPQWRRSALTTTAATAAALALGLSAAAPAAAEGARGTYTGNAETGYQVHTDQGKIGTTLFTLTLEDGTELLTYCIDFETQIRGNAAYVEDEWANYPGEGNFSGSNPGKVHWILQNSYPTIGVDELAEASGVEGLDQKAALAGTQLAIWHFSNGVSPKDSGNEAEVVALYEYLVENAEELASGGEPEISLGIDPAEASGSAGEIVGEFTVSTSADSVPLTLDGPEGVELVDLDGNPIDSASNGDVFGVMVPEDAEPGEATVSAVTSTTVQAGRLFKGEDEEPTQTLITAQSGEASVERSVTATWNEAGEPEPTPSPSESPTPTPTPSPSESPSPTPDDENPPEEEPEESDGGLPVTGTALGGLIAAAALALGGGGAAMYLARKRRSGVSDTTEEG